MDKPFSQKLVQQIRDAKIEVTKEAESERRMRVMKDTVSPSEIADNMLKQYATQKAAADAAAAKAAPAVDKDKKTAAPAADAPKKSEDELSD